MGLIDMFVGATARIFVGIFAALSAVIAALGVLFLLLIAADRVWAWWTAR